MKTGNNTKKNNHETGMEVAVIGMAGRFPGARNLEEYWELLKNGVEAITQFTDEELIAAGVAPSLLKNPNYVKARGVLADIEYFDAPFFGYTPSEAQVMDPQQRLFHECAWHALEDAGYDPWAYSGLIGVYAGARASFDWEVKTKIAPNDGSVDDMTLSLLQTRDHLSTRISYLFNLRGPSYSFYTACSTSLVAIHLANQAVLSGECDMALAGGVTLSYNQKMGYLYKEDYILSPDGHARAFDANAKGLVDGSAVGLVLLKPLEDARRDRDHIHAIIKGSGINNDGSQKIGYTAPSIKGQEALLREVYSAAEVDTRSIVYVELHGSATPLGDPVEVEALRRAFHKDKGDFIGIGSVKTNIGHCDCAAGVASFIKTVLAIKNRQIPASLNFQIPNPKIDFENSPLYVNTRLKDCPDNEYPLRAGVNSLGLGGTNAHIILQEAPDESELEISQPQRNYFILPLSAKTPTALEKMTQNLAQYLKERPQVNLADVAYTLQKGRAGFPYRRAFVCSGVDDAIKQLSDPDSAPIQPFAAGEKERPLVFMYSGQGSEYIDMGLDLYKNEPSFRQDIDRCFDYLTPIINEDARTILYPQNEQQRKEAEEKIHRIYYTQPVKFIFEYAHSRLLMKWGFTPHALIGYSFGEYMVACTAGVITVEDALRLLVKRGEILEKADPGYLLSVSLPEAELVPLLKPGIYIAGINSERLCLVSGTTGDIEAFEKDLEERNIEKLRYRVICGGHSPVMDPILGELGEKLREVTFHKPLIPYVTGITGTWITPEDAVDPTYFTRQLRQPVRFADALKTLFQTPDSIFMEIGPGTTLINFVNDYKDSGLEPNILTAPMVRHHKDRVPDDYFLLSRAAQLWTYGKAVDWEAFYGDEKRRRLHLPKYPFESQYYWLDVNLKEIIARGLPGKRWEKRSNVKDWFYVPSWKNSLLAAPEVTPDPKASPESLKRPWLVFMNRQDKDELVNELVNDLVKNLSREDQPGARSVITVQQGPTFEKIDPRHFRLDPAENSHYHQLFKELKNAGDTPGTIIHLWNLSQKDAGQSAWDWHEKVQETGYYSLLNIVQAIGRQNIAHDIQLEIVANGMQSVAGGPLAYPEKATLIGPVKIIPQEYPNIKCRAVDVTLPEPGGAAQAMLLEQLQNEFATPQTREQVIAYRGAQRLVQCFEPAPLEAPKTAAPLSSWCRENGVTLIIGGLGGVGLTLAQYLAQTKKARLVLTSRYGLPPAGQWDVYLANAVSDDKTALRIRKVREIEQLGVEVMVLSVDVADEPAMREAALKIRERFGQVNGIIHCGYVPDGTVIDQRTRETSEPVFAPKIKGTLVLHQVFAEQEPLDFFVLCSSMASIFGPVGQVAYTAAGTFQDAFAHYAHYRSVCAGHKTHIISINWCAWAEVGALLDSVKAMAPKLGIDPETQYKAAMRPAEGVDAFVRVMTTGAPQVLVSTQEITPMLEHLNTSGTSMGFQESLAKLETRKTKTLRKRPPLKTDYIAPTGDAEKTIAQIWQDLFGIETVGIRDDFFELGGDSLKAMTVSSRIHKELNIKIPIAAFFSGPTIEELVQRVSLADENKDEKKPQTVIPFAGEKEYYPAAPVQKPLYFRHQKDPGNTYFNIHNILRLEGPVDKKQLAGVFKKLLKRHEIYRTSFHLVENQVMQKIHPLEELDFQVQTRESSEENMQETIRELRTPFDLATAPLFRVTLIQVAKENHILLIDTHLIIIDGTSADILAGEFITLYNNKELPPPAIQYKDYAQWQSDRLQSGELSLSQDYWAERFKDPLPVPALPIDFPRPAVPMYDEGLLRFRMEKDLVHRLKELSRQTGTTMFMVWAAAFNVLLHKYSDAEEIVVGSRIACRPHPYLERMQGKFANTFIFRTRPRPQEPFKKFLAQVKDISLDVFKHQEYACEGMEDYNIIYVYNNMNIVQGSQGPGVFRVSPYEFKLGKTLHDLAFHVTEAGDNIWVLILYSAELFKHETIVRMKEDFLGIFETITQNPDIPLTEIP